MSFSQDWNAFYQSFNIKVKKELKFRLSADVKTTNLHKESSAAIWVRVDNKDNTVGYFDNMGDRPIRDFHWKRVTLEGVINNNTKIICFGGLCKSFGTFCFKNFSLELELDNGLFKEVEILNASFQEESFGVETNGWVQGNGKTTPIKIEEYDISIMSSELNTSERYLQIIGKDSFDINQYSSRIGQYLLALNNIGRKIIRAVQTLSLDELDYVRQEDINSIGAYLMHLSAVEAYYQKLTFENRLLSNEEENELAISINLGKVANHTFQNLPLDYYLNSFRETRRKTFELFKAKSDKWLDKECSVLDDTNLYHWLHILEHQSYHFGEIMILKKMMRVGL
ncbi:DinB family protein [Aquimarina sp. Aq107]|uniref:DinB family protein n=1 Tax=Aquimarina sp. Aq107 TaxID=1191912 RepID=UPI000D550DA3|nr:hypothetical protein [Aquimarina sp. Aq107]